MCRSSEGSFGLRRLLGLRAVFTVVFLLASALGASAQTFQSLISFDITDGALPYYGSLVQGRDGNYYGTTQSGGANNNTLCGSGTFGCGTVFKITPSGALTTIYSFCSQPNCTDGANPWGGLVLGTDGSFYGTTYYGGVNSADGTVFRITPAGALRTMHSFDGTDGANPVGALIQGMDGNGYGATVNGGANGYGTVFRISPKGGLNTLYNFCSQSNCTDGENPYGGLVQATNGYLYGTTEAGGTFRCPPNGCGTIFAMTLSGKLRTLHDFDGEYGAYPYAGLVQANDGNFYGTAMSGVAFSLTPTGKYAVLHIFEGTDSGVSPLGLVQGIDGNFYGTTVEGGNSGWGTIYELTSTGTLTTLFDFCDPEACSYGSQPYAGLLQATNGTFYGTTALGGTDLTDCGAGCGTVYSLGMNLTPFVSLVQNWGKIGTTAEILGQGFTGVTSVSFNGTPAKFVVHSSTYLTATVPQGATTGLVTVTTSGFTFHSNKIFQVLP